MRILVCGTREDVPALKRHLAAALWPYGSDIHIIHGGCPTGVDKYADELPYSKTRFPADWSKHGRAAGPIRNQQMLDEGKPDLVVAIHTDPGLGRGTRDMVSRAKRAGLPVVTVVVQKLTM